MNTNYDEDATQLTQGSQPTSTGNEKSSAEEVKNSRKSGEKWKNVVMSGGAGLFLGGVAASLMGMKNPETDPTDTHHGEELSHPEWTDGEVQVATGVDDSMSFNEAFAAARAEVGPGGVFEWHGQLYGTYYADEWNQMTAEQRAEYESHFSWNHIDTTETPEASHHTAQATTSGGDDDIEVVHVDHPEGATETGTQPEVAQAEAETGGSDGGVEVLGIVHDTESGENYGHVVVDGHDVVLVDVDGDMEFDVMAVDSNGDGQITEDEMANIHGHGLTVEQLGGFTDGTMMADDNSNMDSGMDVSTDGMYDA
jgi:hypothetical protein